MGCKIGEHIATLRREKGVTQEELGKALKVSSQAVSKWECGGTPDVELLPAIAEYFGVSIDRLFGIEWGWPVLPPPSESKGYPMREAFEVCWSLQQRIMGRVGDDPAYELALVRKNNSERTFSSLYTEAGITLMRLNEELPYFLLMPEPQNGWNALLDETYEYRRFFGALSQPDVLGTLLYLYGRPDTPFTLTVLAEQQALSRARAEAVVNLLLEYRLLSSTRLATVNGEECIYTFQANPAFLALLAFAQEMIERPCRFFFHCGSRNRPYLPANT